MSNISPQQQEIQVLPNKDADGNNYLKVLLLSNKLTRNHWIAPFENIGKLPKEVKESFLNIPWIPEHDYSAYKKLKEDLEAQGKSDEEVLAALIEKSNNDKLGYVDHIFDDNPLATALYGQVKITDPEENEYINQHNRPSRDFSSPGIYGDTIRDEQGNIIYNIDSIRAYQQSAVKEPAFSPQEAAIKGVCKNGNSESCKKVLAVAGGDNPIDTIINSSTTVTPMENVNNNCSCNKDITMSTTNQPNNAQSTQQPTTQQVTSTPEQTTAQVTIPNNNNTTGNNLLQGASQSTIEAMERAKQEAINSVKNKEQEKQQQKTEEQINSEIEFKNLKKDLETERAQKLEMRNFFLEKMLISTIPRESFKKEDEFIEVKEKTKGFINKYNMGLEDADWLINTVANGIPKEESKPKKDVGVAGLYNPDNFLKTNNNSATSSSTVPQSSNSEFDDSEYPIKF